VIGRTEHTAMTTDQVNLIKKELSFIEQWLDKWAPEDVKFNLAETVDPQKFDDTQKKFLNNLAGKIETAPSDADGEWFHKAIYEFKESHGLQPAELFVPLYQALIGRDRGPRAGWFLSSLPREWLVKRLRLEA
jgi:lysyl-tRNA synthetase class 1